MSNYMIIVTLKVIKSSKTLKKNYLVTNILKSLKSPPLKILIFPCIHSTK